MHGSSNSRSSAGRTDARVPFYYQSGEPIQAGDPVRLHGEPAEIEFVADPGEDPENWFVTEYGGGVMILEPKVFGRLFVDAPVCDYEGLAFVSRKTDRA